MSTRRRGPRPHLAVVSFLVSLAAAMPAVAAPWRPVGPPGGTVIALAGDARRDVLWAGTRAGVFRSLDGGLRWQPANGDLPRDTPDGGSWIMALAVPPVGPRRVYASALLGGVFASADGGRTWQPRNEGLVGSHAEILLAHPNVPELVYATTAAGIFRSENSGEAWTRLPSFPTTVAATSVTSLALDPESPRTLWVGLAQTLMFTADAGVTWSHVAPGLFANQFVDAIAVDPANGRDVWVATASLADGTSALWRSRDGGITWQREDAGLPPGKRITALLLPRSEPGTVYAAAREAGVFRRREPGAWQPAGAFPHVVARGLVARAAKPGHLFAAGRGLGWAGVFASADGGERWVRRNRGLTAWEVDPIVVDAREPGLLYAGTAVSGLLRSADGGATWQPANRGLGAPHAGARQVAALAIDPHVAGALYAAAPSGLFRSADRGRGWTPLSRPAAIDPHLLAPHPRRPGWLLAGTWDGLFQSTDGGHTWERAGGDPGSLAIAHLTHHPTTPATVWAGAFFTGPPDGNPIPDGLFRSDDHGASWQRIYDGSLSALAVSPQNPAVLYAVDVEERLLRSTNGGATFLPVGDTGVIASHLLLDRHDSRRLFAAHRLGVVRSLDGGVTWAPWNEGLLHVGVTSIAFSRDGRRLFVATGGGGVYVRPTG
jgi:photosystem II stability/assembly factor-like uncharacterized protein